MRQTEHIGVRRALLALIVAATRPAHAGFSAELVDVVPEANFLFRYNYQLIFQTLPGKQRLDAGNGVLAPGTPGSQDFITIYDVGTSGEISGVTAGPGFMFQVQPTGVDAPAITTTHSNGSFDSAGFVNVTYRYVGPPVISDDTVFTGFSFLSTLHPFVGGPHRVSAYSSQRTDNFGLDISRKISSLGPVEVPPMLIPEPSTWLLLVLACVAVAALRRRAWRRRIGLLALAMGLILSATRTTHAGFSVELVEIVPEGNLFRYNYQLIFQTLPGRHRLESGNGLLAPGVIGSQDFITIYDIGLPSDISGVTAGPGFMFQVQPTGVDAPAITPFDFAGFVNVTYRYVGPPMMVSDDTVFTGFSFLNPYHSIVLPPRSGQYSSQFTDSLGLEANRKIAIVGPVLVPSVLIPEPNTWLLLMFACLGVIVIQTRLGRCTPRSV
jgi:hypothetical protein